MEESETKKNIILYIDIGSVNCRVSLFVRKGSRFEFIGAVTSRTIYTESGELHYDSIASAIRKLEKVTERSFLDDNNRIIVPQKLGMIGADQVAVSCSGGDYPRIVLIGLTEKGSVRALRQLLSYSGLVPSGVVCAMSGNSMTENVDQVLASDPDIVLIAGGTEGGAERAVYRLGEILMLADKSIAPESRPKILYLGSSAARGQFQRVFSGQNQLFCGGNVLSRPNTDVPPSAALKNIIADFLKEKNPALQKLSNEVGVTPMLSELAFGRSMRLFGRMTHEKHSALGIEVGAGRTLTAFGKGLDLNMNISDIGMGNTFKNILDHYSLSEIMPWLPFQMKEFELRDYIWNKSVHPELVPANDYSAQIEQTVLRFIIHRAIAENSANTALKDGSLGMVLLSGSVFRHVPDPGDALRAAMDSVHPLGITDYYLDLNGLISAIGCFAEDNPELAAQITSPSVFLNLGRVITPISTVKEGRRIFSISLRDDAGSVKKYDIIQGSIKRIYLEYGRYYELNWYNLNSNVSIPGVQTWTPISFKSGCFGLIFDMRGEELTFPKERTAQIHLLERWKQEVGKWKD